MTQGRVAPERQCTAMARSGKRCGKPAVIGSTICSSHGGALPQVMVARVRTIAERLEPLIDAVEDVLERNKASQNDRMVIDSVKALIPGLTLLAKLTGELDERPEVTIAVVATPGWRSFEADLLEALDPHPDARQAVVARLRELGAGDDH